MTHLIIYCCLLMLLATWNIMKHHDYILLFADFACNMKHDTFDYLLLFADVACNMKHHEAFEYLLLFADVASNMEHHETFDYLLLSADVACNMKHHDTFDYLLLFADVAGNMEHHEHLTIYYCLWCCNMKHHDTFDYLLLFADVASNMEHHETFDYLLLSADVACNMKHHETMEPSKPTIWFGLLVPTTSFDIEMPQGLRTTAAAGGWLILKTSSTQESETLCIWTSSRKGMSSSNERYSMASGWLGRTPSWLSRRNIQDIKFMDSTSIWLWLT